MVTRTEGRVGQTKTELARGRVGTNVAAAPWSDAARTHKKLGELEPVGLGRLTLHMLLAPPATLGKHFSIVALKLLRHRAAGPEQELETTTQAESQIRNTNLCQRCLWIAWWDKGEQNRQNP